MVRWVVGSILHGVDPLIFPSFLHTRTWVCYYHTVGDIHVLLSHIVVIISLLHMVKLSSIVEISNME